MISLPKQLVVIGDSSVYGWGDNEGGGWCERLRKDWCKTKWASNLSTWRKGRWDKKFHLDGKKNGHLEEKREEINLKQSCLMLVLTTLQQLVRKRKTSIRYRWI